MPKFKYITFKEAHPDDWLIILDKVLPMLGIDIAMEETSRHREYTIFTYKTNDESREEIRFTVNKDGA